mgnify:CR=1 FL=1
MADPKGFMTTPREVAARRPVEERVHDWKEVYPGTPGRALLPIITPPFVIGLALILLFGRAGAVSTLLYEWFDIPRSRWLYGLPELHGTREALKTATRVAVPGCHATGFIAPVAPLVELGIIPKAAHLNVTSLTGYSGGGKKMITEYEAERTNKALNAPRPYGLALHHKHLPEMAAVTGLDTAPNFVPVVADYYAGMETMIPLDVTALGVSAPQVASALAGYYAGQPMVKVHPLCEGTDGGFLAANKLAGKDTLEIYCLANPDGTQMQLISLFDNLGKGSSGAAVQCMNLMLGLEETRGLAR